MHRLCPLYLLIALTTCSGGDPELTADEFKAQYPKAYCDHVFRCCGGDERSYGSSLICEQQITQKVAELLGFTSADTPFAKFLPVPARKCIDSLRATTCADVTLVEPGCAADVVEPLHKEGEECTYYAECTTYYCVQPQKLARGSCGPTGDLHCSSDDRSCNKGNACVNGECVLRKGTAQACGAGNECESGICSSTTKSCLPRTEPFCDGK